MAQHLHIPRRCHAIFAAMTGKGRQYMVIDRSWYFDWLPCIVHRFAWFGHMFLNSLLPRTLVCLLGPTNLQTAPSLACASTADVSYHSLQLLLITGVMSTHADIVVQPPSVGMTTDARGRPQYVPLKGGGQVHAQYITEGLVSGVLVLLGAGGLIVLERVRLAARRPSSVNRCAPLALCLLPSSLSLSHQNFSVCLLRRRQGRDRCLHPHAAKPLQAGHCSASC